MFENSSRSSRNRNHTASTTTTRHNAPKRKHSAEEPSTATDTIVISSDEAPEFEDYPELLDDDPVVPAPVTQDLYAHLSAPDEIPPCACKTSCTGRPRGRAKPCCSRWGISCTPSCACAASETCNNIWNAATKARLFGTSEGMVEARPNACSIAWYVAREHQGRKRTRRDGTAVTTKSNSELDFVDLYGIICQSRSYDSVSEFDASLAAFRDGVDGSPTPVQAMRLVRYAFTADRDLLGDGERGRSNYWFSLCGDYDGWVDSGTTRHCWTCGECDDWRVWHCKVCRKCRYGVSIPCEKCGGVTELYHMMKEMETY